MTEDTRTAFIKAATWHGGLDEAERWLSSQPELAFIDIHTSAITGNVKAVHQFLAEDPANATAISGPYGGNALVYLSLSKYLRFDKRPSDDFLQIATALLDAGADPNSGFWVKDEFETALYGAAGVAHHGELTKLLLKYGADPNDPEAVYHSPETDDNDALKALVETGKLTEESLSIMLIRKHDWHDYDGVKYLLEHGANPNGIRSKGWYPMHHALARSNALPAIQLLLDHNADPYFVNDGLNAISRAAREGRKDVLALFEQRGIVTESNGVDRLIIACAMGNGETVQAIIKDSPALLQEMMAMGDHLLARFCLNNNEEGVNLLLDIGVNVNSPYKTGDGYFGIPAGSLPIHIVSWLNHPRIVQLLIEKGSLIDMPDKNGQTPLALAVRACVDSYWTYRRSPDSVQALLNAGASTKNIPYPSGYEEVDSLLRK
jgi:ankyrin repeat protein